MFGTRIVWSAIGQKISDVGAAVLFNQRSPTPPILFKVLHLSWGNEISQIAGNHVARTAQEEISVSAFSGTGESRRSSLSRPIQQIHHALPEDRKTTGTEISSSRRRLERTVKKSCLMFTFFDLGVNSKLDHNAHF